MKSLKLKSPFYGCGIKDSQNLMSIAGRCNAIVKGVDCMPPEAVDFQNAPTFGTIKKGILE